MDEESIANLTRIVANFRECNLVDGYVATFALIRAQFASIRDCAFRDELISSSRGDIRDDSRRICVHSRLYFQRRTNRERPAFES